MVAVAALVGASVTDPDDAVVVVVSVWATLRCLAMWVEKKTPWTTLVSLCLSIGQYRFFFLCIGLQCFGSSGSKVAAFPYKCSRRSTLCQLPAPAGNRNFQYKCSTQSTFWQLQLESSNFSVVCAGHFGSSGSKVAAFQCKQV